MVLNSIKCYFMCIGQKRENETFIFRNVCYKNSKEKVMLRVITDNKFTLTVISRKTVKKMVKNALLRILKFLNNEKKI